MFSGKKAVLFRAAARCATRAAAWSILALVPASAIGCAALGAAAYKFSSGQKVPAAYVPAKEPLVVFVQRESNPADSALESQRISHCITDELREHKVGPMIDSASMWTMTTRQSGGSVWAAAQRPTSQVAERVQTIPELGRAVGAKQVLYVDLYDFTVDPTVGSDLVRGHADARVRIIDTATGQTLWPRDTTQGRIVSVAAPYVQEGQTQKEQSLRDQMCQDLADKVAKLFFISDQTDEPPDSPLDSGLISQ